MVRGKGGVTRSGRGVDLTDNTDGRDDLITTAGQEPRPFLAGRIYGDGLCRGQTTTPEVVSADCGAVMLSGEAALLLTASRDPSRARVATVKHGGGTRTQLRPALWAWSDRSNLGTGGCLTPGTAILVPKTTCKEPRFAGLPTSGPDTTHRHRQASRFVVDAPFHLLSQSWNSTIAWSSTDTTIGAVGAETP